jgi:hypothetical protein
MVKLEGPIALRIIKRGELPSPPMQPTQEEHFPYHESGVFGLKVNQMHLLFKFKGEVVDMKFKIE